MKYRKENLSEEYFQKAIDTLDIEMTEEEEKRRGRSIEKIVRVYQGLFSHTRRGRFEKID